ncbi:MFS transporter [Pseudomaricurvus alkylphenolicus]|uniref:MFS transporter n=1 Tax=Pseudomaricurvus alkylphenolicus TaxID=1306991 RepID=UPI001420088B|nr:MFS transporter [Pseudomaricurvus alkylphenolicus]NIB40892.1 MFS transporter [Pseudomaricurvus alkylphenolicus]
MTDRRILFSLLLTYFVFAILLNSVGTVILQVIGNYEVSKQSASVLEGFKDLPIAVVSFVVASFLPRLGFRNAMMVGLFIVTIACLSMPLFPSFLTTKLLFMCAGISFALVKVSVYSSVGLLSRSSQHHASILNTVEGTFMVGVLAGYWLFSAFIDSADPSSQSWLQVYWWLAGLCVVNIGLLLSTPFDESEARSRDQDSGRARGLRQDFVDMLKLTAKPMVCIFVLSAFLYVLIEQGIGTWLPTFNNEILKLPAAMSVQATSIFAACLAIGRLSAGVVMRRFDWYPVLNVCILAMGALIILTLPLTRGIEAAANIGWFNAPLAAYVFPLIGLFMAPIYPAINSVMLSSLPKYQHSAMTGLIVIFSSLGGTTGSIITGVVFGRFDGQTAFYLSLLPLSIILVALYFFRRQVLRLGGGEEPSALMT